MSKATPQAATSGEADQLLLPGQGYCCCPNNNNNNNNEAADPEHERLHMSHSGTLRSTASAQSNQTASTTITANLRDSANLDEVKQLGRDWSTKAYLDRLAFNAAPWPRPGSDLDLYGLDDNVHPYTFKGNPPELYSRKKEFIYTRPLVEKKLVLKKTCEWWLKKKCNNMSTHWQQHAWLISTVIVLGLAGVLIFVYSSAPSSGQQVIKIDGTPLIAPTKFIDPPTTFVNDTIVVNWSDEDNIENDDIGDFEDIGDDNRSDFVTPIKYSNFSLSSDDLLYESKRNSDGNSSQKDYFSAFSKTGTFRSKSSQIWDPHPEYILNIFKKTLHLRLHQDTSFIPSNTFRVIRILNNRTEEADSQEQGHYLGCYYKGYVEGDRHSAVAVSLCGGMTGYIKTGFGTLLIQPVNQSSSDEGGSEILHRVWRHSSRNARHAVSDFELDLETLELAESVRQKLTRRKRHSLGNQVYTLEVLIAVDGTMVEFHKNDLSSYILILLSIVSNIFSDASIGNSIHISLVNLLELRDNIATERGGNSRANSTSELLKHFCTFLSKKGYHYDTAMLITRDQICGSDREKKCHTLGLAELGTVCKPRSCSIVQDNGLPAAFTIAHELGHILNMPHDDDDRCRAHNSKHGNKNNLHIMSSVMGDNMHPWSWSKCSQHYVSEFLEKADKSCLEDTPTSYIPNMTTKQPGEIYSLDHQCQLIHGNQSLCCHMEEECKRLWCKTTNHASESCRSSNLPWADGTPCNHHRHWCQKGKCVPRKGNSLLVVNGGWGPWTAYTPCSLTCGGGVQESRRECNNPLPEHGGKYCEGARKKYRSCNVHTCPTGTMDSREQQCYDMNGRNLNIKGVSPDAKWIPKYGLSEQDKCKLFCRVETKGPYFQLEEKVKDGTTCSFDSFDKCVNGICRPGGCDNELNSLAKLDKCGVCEGRNDTCEELTGNFYVSDLFKQKKSPSCFYYVTTIPKGASNIVITQPGDPKMNYIALSDDRRRPLLNNNNNVVIPYAMKDYYAGVTFEYNGSNSTIERVNTTHSRKLKRNLVVEIISIDASAAKNNDSILMTYTYTIDRTNYKEPEIEIYRWEMQAWNNCDSLCQGTTHRMPTCVSTTKGLKVAPQFCDESAKPKVEYRSCNTDCALSLNVSSISECSASCGQLGTREKTYNCIQTFVGISRSNIVDMSYCEMKFEIERHEQCREGCWDYTEWSTCSKTCGTGTQVREVHCYLNGKLVQDELCNPKTKKLNEDLRLRACNNEPCEPPKNQRSVTHWLAGEWGECDDWCKKNRTVTCTQPNGYGCPADKRPKEVRNCCQIKYMSDWTECSVECGWGVREKVQYCTRVYKPDVPGTPRRRVYINDSYCQARRVRRPALKKSKKRCKINCRWTASDWTHCSEDCADDYQSRYVSCESFQGKTISERYCDPKKKPAKRKMCNNCVRRQVKVLRPCNCDGYGHRRVFCYDSTNRRIACPTRERVVKHKCTPPRECRAKSCQDLQRMHRFYNDGEYTLYVRSRASRIYCHNMNSHTPKEYITLNPLENYAIYYDYKTQYPDRCPPESRDHEYYNNQNSGRTSFRKLRINITDLRVIENDFEFATTVGSQPQAYGSAGDCYNRNGACPQGDFSIDLEHTGFQMRPGTVWNRFGPSVVMQRVSGFETATTTRRAFCGGYCGRCSISASSGLYLDVV